MASYVFFAKQVNSDNDVDNVNVDVIGPELKIQFFSTLAP